MTATEHALTPAALGLATVGEAAFVPRHPRRALNGRRYHRSMSDRLAKLQRLLDVDPTDPFVLYGIAQEHAKGGDQTRAIEFYDRTLAADPGYLYAYFHKARAQQADGEIAAARATVQAGIHAAHRAGDAKALGELSTLQVELAEENA